MASRLPDPLDGGCAAASDVLFALRLEMSRFSSIRRAGRCQRINAPSVATMPRLDMHETEGEVAVPADFAGPVRPTSISGGWR
ncbi:MAG: hypothetical protein ABIV63_09870, partial [Caldimonas sp.]